MASSKSILVLQWLCLIFLVTELGAVSVLVANDVSVKLVDSEHPNKTTDITTDIVEFLAFDYHIIHGVLYLSERKSRTTGITKLSLIKDTHESSSWMLENSYAGSIAVDWIHDRLYWTNNGNNVIEKATLEGYNRHVIFESYNGGDFAGFLVLDPFERILFWATGVDKQVTSGKTDGSKLPDLYEDQDIGHCYGLALDISKKMLYIRAYSALYSSSYDGSNLKTLVKFTRDPIMLYTGLTHYSNKLYYPDIDENAVMSFNLETNQTAVVFEKKKVLPERWLNGIKVLHASVQPRPQGASPCTKKCSHFCDNSSCKCPRGFTLDHDEITCIIEEVQGGK